MRAGKRVDPTVTKRVKGWDMGLVRLLVVGSTYNMLLCFVPCLVIAGGP